MRYTWREEKRLRNLRDHYIDLADVEPFFDSPYIERVDDRLDYDEDRWVAIGLLRGHEIVVVYTEEGTTRHLISAREQRTMSDKRTGKRGRVHRVPLVQGLTDFSKLGTRSDAERIAAAKSDPDNPPRTPEWILAGELKGPAPKKVPISLRIDPDVLEFFKAAGGAYQSSINAVLRQYVEHHRAVASARPRSARKG